jgi:hypothetical protein
MSTRKAKAEPKLQRAKAKPRTRATTQPLKPASEKKHLSTSAEKPTRSKTTAAAKTKAPVRPTPLASKPPVPDQETQATPRLVRRASHMPKELAPVTLAEAPLPAEPALPNKPVVQRVSNKKQQKPRLSAGSEQSSARPARAASAPSVTPAVAKSLSHSPKTPLAPPLTTKSSPTAEKPETQAPAPAPVAPPQATAEAIAKKLNLPIPPILLEGDEPVVPPTTGPGYKYATGSVESRREEKPAEPLPKAYGSGRLLVLPRDPHCLFVHWDMSEQAQVFGGLFIRVHTGGITERPLLEVPVQGDSRHWFIYVPNAATTYFLELGCYAHEQWATLATSGAVITPPAAMSEDRTVEFGRLHPVPQPPQSTPAPEQWQMERQPTLAASIERFEPPGFVREQSRSISDLSGALPEPQPRFTFAPAWAEAQETALTEIICEMLVRHEWLGSLELAELVRRQIEKPGVRARREAPPPGPSSLELAISSPPGGEAVSSPFGGEQPGQGKGFWFNVNAELIIYGATEPSAKVTIGGRQIKLRSDGTFSYRFALPDGNYELPAVAVSVDDDRREAALHFTRHTRYQGEVGKHPQDPALKAPLAENV